MLRKVMQRVRKGVRSRRGSGVRTRRLCFENLESRRVLAVIVAGSGDGSVEVDIDGYGSFGRAQDGSATGDAIIDPIGGGEPVGTMYESGVAIGVGTDRRFLSDGQIGITGGLNQVSVTVSGDGTTATVVFHPK